MTNAFPITSSMVKSGLGSGGGSGGAGEAGLGKFLHSGRGRGSGDLRGPLAWQGTLPTPCAFCVDTREMLASHPGRHP